jgi:hypothetical protein
MSQNPFQPPKLVGNTSSYHFFPRLNGFALGTRDALVLSLPVVSILAMVSRAYGKSYYDIAREICWIPLIWVLCAGLVAEAKYRRRVPNSADRRWLDWRKETTTKIMGPKST